MRSIWQIYKTDWLNIFKVPTGIFLIIAIILLPCLYDWVNIKSVWDPYANTGGVKVAVTSEDLGTTVANQHINVGEELIAGLKTNKNLGWTFVDREEAQRGVDRGDYYASILIPADFSAKITGIVEGKLDRPEVIYTVNEKINAVAPKITSSGASTIAKQINENFTKEVSEALLKKLSEVGIKIEEQLPTIRKVERGIFDLESRLPEIQAAGQKVLELENKLPDIHDKAQKIIEVEQKLPEINQAAQYVLKINENWPLINDAASNILAIQNRLPDIEQAVAHLQQVDQHFDKVAQAIETALDKGSKALEIVSSAEEALAHISGWADKGTDLADRIHEFLSANNDAFGLIVPLVKQNLILAQQAADTAVALTDNMLHASGGAFPTAEEIDAVSGRLSNVASMMDHMSALLGRLNNLLPNHPLDKHLARLQTAQNRLMEQVHLLQTISTAIKEGKQPARELITRVNQGAKEASSILGDIISRYDSEIVPHISEGIENLKTAAGAEMDRLQAAKGKLADIQAILEDVKSGLVFGKEELTRIKEDLPQIRAKVHELAQTMQAKYEEFVKAINIAAPFVRDSLPAIGKKLGEAASFIQNDLPAAQQELHKLADFVRFKLPEVETGVHKVAGLVRDDLPQLEQAVRHAANELREFEANGHFADLAKLLRGDIQKESEFLASPVQIKLNRKYPIPNYGSAMSPFYCVLSLWVGATLLISLLKANADNPEGRYKPYQLYLGRLGTFITIGQLQAISIALGDFFILNAYVADKVEFVLFAMLVSAVFVTITYTLLSVFGNVGKGIAIIFMVFQFSSSGGTFPISMTPPFFQALNPFMPFTYAISLLREAVGGILWTTAWRDILYLFGFIGLSLFIALALKRPLSGIIQKSMENAKKTKIIS